MPGELRGKLASACLAVLARRARTSLVVTYEEIAAECDNLTKLEFALDDDAQCVRISVPEIRT